MQGSLTGMGTKDTGAGKVLPNTIFIKDNLLILRGLESETIDLIATDPPFNSKRIFNAPIGSDSEGASFKDIWSFDDIDGIWIEETLFHEYPAIYHLVISILLMGDESLASFTVYMTQRLVEMHRILKPTGSLYLHCDQTAGHYLKIMLDSIFGKENFRNEFIWHYYSGGSGNKQFAKKHDNILIYGKSKNAKFYQQKEKKYVAGKKAGVERLKNADRIWEEDSEGVYTYINHRDVAYIPILNPLDKKERTGYPTQKPLALYELLIKTCTDKGDMVLDPFAGCATTCIAAHKLQRNWIGIDVSERAYDLVAERLEREIGLEAAAISGLIHHRTDIPVRVRDIIRTPNKAELRKRLWQEQFGDCNHCGAHYNIEQISSLHIDHIVPTSRGGHDGDDNKQLLCVRCNTAKGNKEDETAKAIMQKRMQELRGLPNKYRKLR